MGCTWSRRLMGSSSFDSDQVFSVIVVNDTGHSTTRARLEVTDVDLVLHQRGKPAVRWPLRSLRRYGFDSELFSFESGRRCPTGAGIFAFKCRRAEQLFNVVQVQVQSQNDDAVSRDMGRQTPTSSVVPPHPVGNGDVATAGSLDGNGYLEPVRPSRSATRTSVDSISSAGTVASRPPSLLATSDSQTFSEEEQQQLPAAYPTRATRLSSVTSQLPTLPEYVNAADPERVDAVAATTTVEKRPYVNLPAGSQTQVTTQPPVTPKPACDINTNYACEGDFRDGDTGHVYMNVVPESCRASAPMLGEGKDGSRRPVVVQRSVSVDSGKVESQQQQQQTGALEPRQMNYVVLDLERRNCSSAAVGSGDAVSQQVSVSSPPGSVPESPVRVAEGYATIDFDKTAALSIAVNMANTDDSGNLHQRKTRHNATIGCFLLN